MPRKQTVNVATGEVEEVEMTGDELAAYEAQRAVLPPAPVPVPVFDGDLPDDYAYQVSDAVTTLRQYLALAAPTAAQSTAALKLLIRVVFLLVRRAL
jgi:hypothetical protein